MTNKIYRIGNDTALQGGQRIYDEFALGVIVRCAIQKLDTPPVFKLIQST